MNTAPDIIAKIALFFALYAEVFLLVTFFERRKIVKFRNKITKLTHYPTVAVIVPCWNEEKTIQGTAHSLINLEYPKDKLEILLIDDGSNDKTWEVMQEFANQPNFKLIHKKNGGKYTALNLGLEKTESEFVACLDADSFVDKHALIKLLSYLEEHPYTMAVAPSVITKTPNKMVERAQNAEYSIAVYIKKMCGLMGGIHVLPGPFSVFRRRVFKELGPYEHAHGTEDMEIAFRMQTNHYPIDHCPDAKVYTTIPNTIKKLYTQRVRWIYGFIKLVIDYRRVLFKKKYGNFAMFTLPVGIISIIAAVYLFLYLIYNVLQYSVNKIIKWQTVGFHPSFQLPHYSFDWFYLNTESILFLTVALYIMFIIAMMIGYKLSEGKFKFSANIVFYFMIYSMVAPFWVMKAMFNAMFGRKTKWR